MKYVDWVDAVLRTAAQELHEQPSTRMLGVSVSTLARKLSLPIDPGSPEFHGSHEREAIFTAARHLQGLGLVTDMDQLEIRFASEARVARRESLRATWPALAETYLEDEQLEFLRAACKLAEEDHGTFVTLRDLTAEQVYAALGWEWPDMDRVYDIAQVLEDRGCIDQIAAMGGTIDVTPTYRGFVRATEAAASKAQELIRELLDLGESTTVDLKRELNLGKEKEKAEFVRDVLGLANVQARGERCLLIGFDDDAAAFVRSVDLTIDQERLEKILHSYSEPTPEIRYQRVPWETGEAGLLEVIRDRTKVPYRASRTFGGRIDEGAVYVRHGRHTETATALELRDLEEEGRRARES